MNPFDICLKAVESILEDVLNEWIDLTVPFHNNSAEFDEVISRPSRRSVSRNGR